ncbi:hypothetical protein [Paenibacillus tundrae]
MNSQQTINEHAFDMKDAIIQKMSNPLPQTMDLTQLTWIIGLSLCEHQDLFNWTQIFAHRAWIKVYL